MVVLVKKTVIRDRMYAAADVDNPGAGALAVAGWTADGWAVHTLGGRTVGDKLTQRKAVALMLRTARAAAITLASRQAALLTSGVTP